MTHELLALPQASPQALDLMVYGGGAGMLVMVILVGFLVWRDKRRGLSRRAAPKTRAKRPKRR